MYAEKRKSNGGCMENVMYRICMLGIFSEGRADRIEHFSQCGVCVGGLCPLTFLPLVIWIKCFHRNRFVHLIFSIFLQTVMLCFIGNMVPEKSHRTKMENIRR